MHRYRDEDIPLTSDIELLDPQENGRHRRDEAEDEATMKVATRSQPTESREIIPWSALPHKDQLFILGLCRLSEPLSNTCLLPYIYYLMRSIVLPLGGSKDVTPDEEQHQKIAQLSGILVAVFPLAQLATSMLWAKWSDSFGRRPVILLALLVSAIANLGFGFSRSFWMLMFWRTLAGLANGNVGVMRTVTAEVVKERKFQTKAFLLLPLIFNAGMVFGLAVGGWLADPTSNMAWLFGPDGLLNFSGDAAGVAFVLSFPFVLPAIFNFCCLFASLVLAVLGLKETLADVEDRDDIGLKVGQYLWLVVRQKLPSRFSGYSPLTEDDEADIFASEAKSKAIVYEKPAERTNHPKSIWTRDVVCAMVSFGLLPLHNGAFMHIYPVFLGSSPTKDAANDSPTHFSGGLGLKSSHIGLYLSLFGLCGIFLQLFIYPRLQARFSTLGVFRIALYMFPLTYFVAPFLILLPEQGMLRWICIGLVTWSQVMARTLAIPSTVLLLTQSAPSKSMLSRIHGAGNAAASLARAVGPAIGGWVYSKGIEAEMAGMVWWFYLAVVAVVALGWGYTMRKLA